MYTKLGFIVVLIDNRGSDRRGLAFEAELYHAMGTKEIDDQVQSKQILSDSNSLIGRWIRILDIKRATNRHRKNCYNRMELWWVSLVIGIRAASGCIQSCYA